MQQWIDGWVSLFTRRSTKRKSFEPRTRTDTRTNKLSKVQQAISATFVLFLYFPPFVFVFRSQSIITSAFRRSYASVGKISSSADFFNVSFLFPFCGRVFRGAWVGFGDGEGYSLSLYRGPRYLRARSEGGGHTALENYQVMFLSGGEMVP